MLSGPLVGVPIFCARFNVLTPIASFRGEQRGARHISHSISYCQTRYKRRHAQIIGCAGPSCNSRAVLYAWCPHSKVYRSCPPNSHTNSPSRCFTWQNQGRPSTKIDWQRASQSCGSGWHLGQRIAASPCCTTCLAVFVITTTTAVCAEVRAETEETPHTHDFYPPPPDQKSVSFYVILHGSWTLPL